MKIYQKLLNQFKGEPSIEELQQREERETIQLSIAQKETMIKELEARGHKWENFSNDGTKRGINFDKIRAFLRGSKGAKRV